MKKIILIGEINDFEKPTGPGTVIKNLLLEFKNKNLNYQYINSYTTNKFQKIKLIFELIKLIFKKNCIINVHSFGYTVPLIVYYISKINKTNLYYLTLHGIYSVEQSIEYNKAIPNKILKKEKKVISLFPNLICVSEFLKSYVAINYNRCKNVYVAYNSIDLKYDHNKKNHLESNEIKIVLAGGISNRKSILETIDLIDYINKNTDLNVQLHVYGSICNKMLYSKFQKKFISINNVYFHGKVNFSDLIMEYANSHFLIALTKFDTFNLTVLEAMLQYTPAIVSNNAGVSELLTNNKNGFIIDMSKDYYNDIIDILKLVNTKTYENIRNNAYTTAKQYDTKTMLESYIDIFNKGGKSE